MFSGTVDVLTGDVAAVAAETLDQLLELPCSHDVRGVVHGDPECDNLIWHEDTATFVDLDDQALSWFAADACFALRDLAPPAGAPDRQEPVVIAFLRGYRDVRPLTDDELAWWPVLSRASALVTLSRLQAVVRDRPRPDWPSWALRLHDRLVSVADEYTDALLQDRAG